MDVEWVRKHVDIRESRYEGMTTNIQNYMHMSTPIEKIGMHSLLNV